MREIDYKVRVCLVGMKRERKEKGGGKREKKMEKYAVWYGRKILWVGPTNFNPPKSGRKMERKEGMVFGFN